jgi:carbamate kinase
MTAEDQRANVAIAARGLLPIALEHDLVLTHGNGPQDGLFSLPNAAYRPDEEYPLDILDAEAEGMIGYLLQQELGNLLPPGRAMATILTRIEVDPADPAFAHPTKPIGPVHAREEAGTIVTRAASPLEWGTAPLPGVGAG